MAWTFIILSTRSGLICQQGPDSSQGGSEGTRTPDPLHAMQVRYQLRHRPVTSQYLRDNLFRLLHQDCAERTQEGLQGSPSIDAQVRNTCVLLRGRREQPSHRNREESNDLQHDLHDE